MANYVFSQPNISCTEINIVLLLCWLCVRYKPNHWTFLFSVNCQSNHASSTSQMRNGGTGRPGILPKLTQLIIHTATQSFNSRVPYVATNLYYLSGMWFSSISQFSFKYSQSTSKWTCLLRMYFAKNFLWCTIVGLVISNHRSFRTWNNIKQMKTSPSKSKTSIFSFKCNFLWITSWYYFWSCLTILQFKQNMIL